jgi:hypothetical protein
LEADCRAPDETYHPRNSNQKSGVTHTLVHLLSNISDRSLNLLFLCKGENEPIYG